MTNSQFERVYYPKYKNVIEAIARKLAKSDEDVRDDLIQVCMIGLLGLDPAKAKTNEDAWMRNCLRNKAVDHMRFLNRRQFERLDVYLSHNHDVVEDPVTHEPMLVHGENDVVVAAGFYSDGRTRYTSKSQRLAAVLEYGADDEQ